MVFVLDIEEVAVLPSSAREAERQSNTGQATTAIRLVWINTNTQLNKLFTVNNEIGTHVGLKADAHYNLRNIDIIEAIDITHKNNIIVTDQPSQAKLS